MSSLALAMLMWAQAASYGPSPPPQPKPAKPAAPTESCHTPIPTDPGEVVVCAVRPQGYRIDPDVLAAKKAKRNDSGKPKRPDRMVDTSCKVVGPMGCRTNAGIDLLAAAATLGKMADKLSKGESIASMFVTDPQSSEYQLYQQAKQEREAKEQEAEVKAAVKAAQAAKAEAAQRK